MVLYELTNEIKERNITGDIRIEDIVKTLLALNQIEKKAKALPIYCGREEDINLFRREVLKSLIMSREDLIKYFNRSPKSREAFYDFSAMCLEGELPIPVDFKKEEQQKQLIVKMFSIDYAEKMGYGNVISQEELEEIVITSNYLEQEYLPRLDEEVNPYERVININTTIIGELADSKMKSERVYQKENLCQK